MYVQLTMAERLKDLRVIDKKLTLEQLAEQTGLSKSALGKYESLQIKSQAPNGTCCKEIWQKVGRKKCSTNKPPQSAGLKREKRK